MRRMIFWLLIYPALDAARAQAWVARRRIAAIGTPQWAFWLTLWIPLRMISEALYAAVKAGE